MLKYVFVFYIFGIILTTENEAYSKTTNTTAGSEFESPVFFQTDFFENSYRRDSSASERQSVAKLKIFDTKRRASGTCTTFFVRNSANKLVLASARHCADFEFTRACDEGRLTIEFSSQGEQMKGYCTKVIVGSREDDLILFEAHFDSDIGGRINPLMLAYGRVPLKTRLQMIGFPGDRYRKGAMTTTENCWINEGRREIHYSDLTEQAKEELRKMKDSPGVLASIEELKPEIVYSNCTVYGGNSGGPVLIEGKPWVIGLPASYWPGYYSVLYEWVSAQVESVTGFVNRNKVNLEKNGIELVDLENALSI